MVKALLIDWEPTTGERAGGSLVDYKTGLRCHPAWQNDKTGKEIRMVIDGDVTRFEGVEGVKILLGSKEIDAALAQLETLAPAYVITHEALAVESIRQKGVDLTTIKHGDAANCAKCLFEAGVLGVSKHTPERPDCAEMCRRWHVQDLE